MPINIPVLVLLIASFPYIASAQIDELGFIATKPLVERYESDTSRSIGSKLIPDTGHIDWKSSEYVAHIVTPIKLRPRDDKIDREIAKELALRSSSGQADNLFLKMLANTRVDAEQNLSQLAGNMEGVRKIGNIHGKKLTRERLVTDDGVSFIETEYRISMRGVDGVIAQSYGRAIKTAADKSAKNSHENLRDANTTIYIDARGTGLQPALFPRILDEDNNVLFDPATFGKSGFMLFGTFEYVVAAKQAQIPTPDKSDRSLSLLNLFVTQEAFLKQTRVLIPVASADELPADELPKRKRRKRKIIKASSAAGLLKANIIVGKEDAKKLRDAWKNEGLPYRPHIIIVTDGTVGGTEGMLNFTPLRWAGIH